MAALELQSRAESKCRCLYHLQVVPTQGAIPKKGGYKKNVKNYFYDEINVFWEQNKICVKYSKVKLQCYYFERFFSVGFLILDLAIFKTHPETEVA